MCDSLNKASFRATKTSPKFVKMFYKINKFFKNLNIFKKPEIG